MKNNNKSSIVVNLKQKDAHPSKEGHKLIADSILKSFEDNKENQTVYIDRCCHFNDLDLEKISEEIAREVDEKIKGLEK